uniref:Uncharacterized protein n=1 Tax=Rhizobium loti TaxID=381 RepID=Q8KGK2_RHILI|nr:HYPOTHETICAL PROTEIN [Mesorhizobium japonicum R7A]
MPDMSGRGSRSKNDTAVLLPTSAISMIDSAYASSSRALSALAYYGAKALARLVIEAVIAMG